MPFVGASSAFGVTHGTYGVGIIGVNSSLNRPIIPFPRSSFEVIAGLPLMSATLHFLISQNSTELGESFDSEIRLFTTAETDLRTANAQVFAGLTGDGGDHAVVGSLVLSDDLAGSQSMEFSPVALVALFDAINGTDATIGIAFLEFFSDDQDLFYFGVPPGVMMIEVTAVPGAGTLALMALGGSVVARPRRRGTACLDRVFHHR